MSHFNECPHCGQRTPCLVDDSKCRLPRGGSRTHITQTGCLTCVLQKTKETGNFLAALASIAAKETMERAMEQLQLRFTTTLKDEPMSFESSFQQLLEDAGRQAGVDAITDLDGVVTYAANRARALQAVVGQPGYNEAVIATADAVALRAGLQAVSLAEGLDMKILGIIEGGLRIGISALI